MKPLHAPILAAYSEPRARIYQTLLSAPERDWSVSDLAARLPEVSVEAVRTTLYLLLGDHLVEPVAHQRSLTLRLTDAGHSTVRQIAARWEESPRGRGDDS